MLGKVKKWFGIEGLKIAVRTEPKYNREDKSVSGMIVLHSKNDEKVTGIRIKLIEKYSRGRGKNKLIDEYMMADEKFAKIYTITAEEDLEIPFEINFEEKISNMDEIQRRNILFGGIIAAAKFLKKATSVYRLEIEADVTGTKFNPFVSEEIILD